MVRGFRVGISRSVTGGIEISFDFAEIGYVLLDWVFLWIHVAPEHDVHPIGLDHLNLREEVRVKAELYQRPRLR